MLRFLACGASYVKENKMKKFTSALIIVGFVLVSSCLWASPPVCPPFEGFIIDTTTDIVVYGNSSDEENFDWKWNNAFCEGKLYEFF